MSEDPLEFWKSRNRFLLKIAQEVDQLVSEKSEKLARFRQQVGVFVKKYEDYLANIESNKENAPYLLAPVLPDKYRAQLSSPQSKQDLLPDYYFLLTLIHDNLLSPPQFIPINKGIYQADDQWVGCCWSHYGRLMEGNKTEALIETALERVKADLANEKPEETEQNTIWTKIKAWLWKLYEKTVKAIVAAVLEWWSKPK